MTSVYTGAGQGTALAAHLVRAPKLIANDAGCCEPDQQEVAWRRSAAVRCK